MGFVFGVLIVIGIGGLTAAFMNTKVGEGCCMGSAALMMLFGIGAVVLFMGVLAFGCMSVVF